MFSFFTFVTATDGASAPIQWSACTRVHEPTRVHTHAHKDTQTLQYGATSSISHSANIGVCNVSKAAARGLNARTVGNCLGLRCQSGGHFCTTGKDIIPKSPLLITYILNISPLIVRPDAKLDQCLDFSNRTNLANEWMIKICYSEIKAEVADGGINHCATLETIYLSQVGKQQSSFHMNKGL